MVDWNKTRFPGVRYWVSDTRKHKGKPERCFVIRYKRHEKPVSETVGWQGQGVTPEFCAQLRGQITSNIKTGEGFQSLKEKRELEEARRQGEAETKAAIEKENIIFDVIAQKYLDWAKTAKKSWKHDVSRYDNHVKPIIGQTPIKDIHILTLEGLKKKITPAINENGNSSEKNKKKPKELSQQTKKHILILIRGIFNWAIGRGLYQGENPVTKTAKIDKSFLKVADNSRTRFLSYEEAELLLGVLFEKSLVTHDISLLSLYSGMRMGEIFALKGTDLNFSSGVIHIKDPKSGESRPAYIIDAIEEMLVRRYEELNKPSELVFKSTKGGPLKEISNIFERVVDELGFNHDVDDRRDRVVPHTLRHTFASWLAMNGASLITLKNLMGHKSLEMVLRYAHLSPSHEKEAVLGLKRIKPNKIIDIDSFKKR